jgi:hypothetical protein
VLVECVSAEAAPGVAVAQLLQHLTQAGHRAAVIRLGVVSQPFAECDVECALAADGFFAGRVNELLVG